MNLNEDPIFRCGSDIHMVSWYMYMYMYVDSPIHATGEPDVANGQTDGD